MNRFKLILAVLALAAAGAAAWYLSRPQAAPEGWLGYVEGEAILIAAPVSGELARLDAARGAMVTAGQPLFALNPQTAAAELRRLEAAAAQARAARDDLAKQRQRPAEQDVTRAQRRAALAELARAEKEQRRIAKLAADGFATRARLESATAALDAARASVAQADAALRAGALAGRDDQRRAAEASVQEAEAALAAQRRRAEEIAPRAPVSAQVEQTYFLPGEWVAANQPVVSLIAPERIKLRFFIPQAEAARLPPGARVRVRCDGCGAPFEAQVRYVSPRAEFTPPVIYSERARAKLVFLVEAHPVPARRLPLGLPVEVEPFEAARAP